MTQKVVLRRKFSGVQERELCIISANEELNDCVSIAPTVCSHRQNGQQKNNEKDF